MPRGRKRCQGCSEDVAAASKQCPNCGLALQKGPLDPQENTYGSPVQMKRMGLRTAILIRTPDARVERERTRRVTGQGNRSTAGRGHPTVAEHLSSGSSIPEGDQLSPYHADQMGHDSQQQGAVSPVSRVPLRWHSTDPVQQYVRGLQLSQHRCVLVGDNIRGAYLYAVAGYDCTNTGNICIVVRSKSLISYLLHVGGLCLVAATVRVPAHHAGQQEHACPGHSYVASQRRAALLLSLQLYGLWHAHSEGHVFNWDPKSRYLL